MFSSNSRCCFVVRFRCGTWNRNDGRDLEQKEQKDKQITKVRDESYRKKPHGGGAENCLGTLYRALQGKKMEGVTFDDRFAASQSNL